MAREKIVINNMKDFFNKLSEILSDFYEGVIDANIALTKINKIKKLAEEAGIQVNVGDNILNHIEPSSSYSYEI